MADAARRELIVDTVRRADPAVSAEAVGAVLAEAVRSARSLRRLAEGLASSPDMFAVGPTSAPPVLDRFTRALTAVGAQGLCTIHPVCEHCGRRRPRKARTDGGGMCSACWARSHKQACSVCGTLRRVSGRDRHGRAVCVPCGNYQQRRHRLDDLVDRITAVVQEAGESLTRQHVAAAADRVAPSVSARTRIVEQLQFGPPVTTPAKRPPEVSRLLAELRMAGATLPAAQCEDCARPAEPLIIYHDVVRCRHCATRCPGCQRHNKQPDKAWCGRCQIDPARPRGTCSDCQRAERPLDANRRCRPCRERAAHCCSRCGDATGLTRHRECWMCHRCALAVELDDMLGATGSPAAALVALRAAIVAADNPGVVRNWLRNSSAGRLLPRLASGEVPLTHEALDAAGEDRSINHLRALLVAIGALAAEDRSIDRLERFADRHIDAAVVDTRDRKAVRSWLRWQVLSRLRTRAASGASMAHSVANARQALRRVAEFVDTLQRHGRNLATATQADLDDWFARPAVSSWQARPFLVWARKRGHLPRQLHIPVTRPSVLRPALDDTRRWAIARQLVTDEAIAVDDRVAAALVVLYGQTVTRVVRLTRADLRRSPDNRTVVVNLDGNRMPIHEPFATLIEQLPRRRANGVTDQLDGPWLFPGRKAGEHVVPVIVANRLRALGIEPRNMRNNARAQLATEIPAAMLGQLIGVSPETATRWAAVTSGNWAAYAAGRSR